MPYMRHIPTGRVYPYNEHMHRRGDMELIEDEAPAAPEVTAAEPAPAKPKAKRAAKPAPAAPEAPVEPVVASDTLSGDIDVDIDLDA